ncbi:MAG TPA: ATP-binding cassette domain-containing protein [Bacilli bacterium]|nr:ATP-binding cassette domain-containing protein [Bacilli bacterium]
MNICAIKAENICKKFGDQEILTNLNLEINDGDFICITGESGKGKTTLLNIMGMLDAPDSGNICIKGVNNPKLRSKVGCRLIKNELFYVFQNYGLVEDKTVKYNLEISAKFSGLNKVSDFEKALTRVGLNPDFLKKKVFTLSGGEQQRCALARMYLKNFNIVLADEPTGSLDPDNRDMILEIFKNINKEGKTVIIVTHDKEVVKCAGKVVKL